MFFLFHSPKGHDGLKFDWHGFEQERRFYVDMYECLFFLIVAHFILDFSREIEVILSSGDGDVVDAAVL